MKIYIVQKLYHDKNMKIYVEILGSFASKSIAKKFAKDYLDSSFDNPLFYDIEIRESELDLDQRETFTPSTRPVKKEVLKK